ncbi:MAG: hypothetical protein ACUVXA_20315 [Candidatus Jordarchaeum sp.]|uniref:hypothetical protein n=1 Tax=Candidatus Jordarchaeum sp. TaxID=2823881 RepID=UPI00404B32A0
MKERRGLLNPSAILTLFLAGGVLAYIVGIFNGFLFLFGGALFQIVDYNIVFSTPLWFLAFYPYFSIVSLPSFFIPYYGLPPLSLWFLLLGAASIIFALFSRYIGVSFAAFTAVIFGVIQFLLISSITGLNLTGTNFTFLPTIPGGMLPYLILLFEKNTIALIISIILFGAGTVYVQRIQHIEAKKSLSRFEAPSLEHFEILKATQIRNSLIVLLLFIFLIAAIYGGLLLQLEFPNYYPFMGLLNWNNAVFSNSSIITLYLFLIPIVVMLHYSDLNKFLAKNYTSIIIKTLEKRPVLQLEEIQRSLKVEEVKQKYFENLVGKVCSEAEKLGNPVGIYKDYVYLEKPLVHIAQKEIQKEERADVYKIASEIFVHPEILIEIYRVLTFKGKIKGFTITSEGFLTKYQYQLFGVFKV